MNQGKEREIDLTRILYLLSKHKARLISIALVGLVFGAALMGINYLKNRRTPRHVISCSFAIVAKNSGGSYGNNNDSPSASDVKLAVDIVKSVIFVTKSDRVLTAAVENKQFLGMSVDEIRNNLEIKQHEDTQIVTLKLRWINGNEGLSIVQSICEVVPGILIETLDLGSVSVVDYPKDVGIETSKPDLAYLALPILFIGLYIVYKFLEQLIHPTLTDVNSVEKILEGRECLGVIPEDEEYFSNKPFPLYGSDPEHFQVKEALGAASHMLRHYVEHEGIKCIYVTSSETGEGKTGLIANLGIELSRQDKRVLLIDMDVKRPSLGTCFFDSLSYEHTLNSVYSGYVEAADAVISVAKNLYLLPGMLEAESVRLDKVLRDKLVALFPDYDVVLVDAPPIGLVSDTMLLNQMADRALMVVGFDGVWVETIKKNIEKVHSSGLDICGVIITHANRLLGSGFSSQGGPGTYSGSGLTRRKKRRKKRGLFSKKKDANREDD